MDGRTWTRFTGQGFTSLDGDGEVGESGLCTFLGRCTSLTLQQT